MTKVKICGITNLNDALIAADLGADLLGFNFYKKSPRYIEPHSALEIARSIPGGVAKVGVFVNMEPHKVAEFVDLAGLDAVQLHGDEDSEFVLDLRTRTNAIVIKALRIGPNTSIDPAADLDVDHILLDTFTTDNYGGSGKVFDWARIGEIGDLPAEFFLAGGLDPANVAEAVRTVRPYAVDAASGIESSPGKKDLKKLEAFIGNAKSA